MKRLMLSVAAVAALSACTGTNPFDGATAPDGATPEGIPTDLQGDLTSISYAPPAGAAPGRLIVRGISLDGTPFETVYNRRAAMDRGGYEAYAYQENALSRHTTAYVKEIDGTRGTIVVSGGQFGYYFGGSTYSRNGGFSRPNSGSVTYSGNYVGMLNSAGDGGDLLPTTAPPDVRPGQAAEVTGRVVINADFIDNATNGTVFERTRVDGGAALANLDLAPTAIDANGVFVGDVTQLNQDRGTYGGIFGGPNSSAVAGTLFVQDHIDGVENEEEYGLFVLGQCGTANADASLCP